MSPDADTGTAEDPSAKEASGLLGESRALLGLAAPLVASEFFSNAVVFSLVILLGRFDSLALAGASIGMGMLMIPGALAGSGAGAVAPLVGQAFGGGDWDRISTAVRKGMVAIPLTCAPVALLIAFLSLKLESFGMEEPVARQASLFVMTALPGILAQPVFVVLSAALTALGATKSVFRVTFWGDVAFLTTALILIHGDTLLDLMHLPPIGVSKLGAMSAGLAIDASQVAFVSGAWRSFATERRRHLEAAARNAPSPPPPAEAGGEAGKGGEGDAADFAGIPITVPVILAMAAPVAASIFGQIGAGIVLTFFSGLLGSAETAGFRIARLVPDLMEPIMISVGAAAGMRVAWAVGAKRDVKARLKGAVVFALLGSCIIAFLFLVLPSTLLPRTASHDENVIGVTLPLIPTVGVVVVVIGINHILGGSLRGAGDFKGSAIAQVCGAWLVGVPLAYTLAFHFGLGIRGLWYGSLIGLVISATALAFRATTYFSRPIKRL